MRRPNSTTMLLPPQTLRHRRRGVTIVLSCFAMIVVFAMLALAVDIGYVCVARSELTRSVDAAALAGASALADGPEAAHDAAVEYLVRNPLGRFEAVGGAEALAQLKSAFLLEHGQELHLVSGNWDPVTRTMEPDSENPSAMQVSIRYTNRPLFFASALGIDSFAVEAEAVAMCRPRDIMLVLDFSASMNDDSELKSIDKLGQDHVVANIAQMWAELDAPSYGNMDFEPDWVTIPGQSVPASVRWRGYEVDVAAETDIQVVRLYKSNDYYTTYYSPGSSGTFSYSGNLIYKCKIKINGQWETFDFFNNDHIRRGLALDGVTYPSEGSWNDYIDYARNHNSSMSWYDGDVYSAGYRRKFGALTLINFWNKNKPASDETPALWKVSAQPVAAVKNAVDLFVDYIETIDADDRIGLAVYNSASGDGETESGLTYDLPYVADIMRQRQAGHYHRYTNIAAGMQNAREEIQANGRQGALKMIVLMTDGQANWNAGGYDVTAARSRVIEEADLCRGDRIPIVTISLGADADSDLMAEVAAITDSVHFNIPGGATVAQYSAQLLDVFEKIARARPLQLVQ